MGAGSATTSSQVNTVLTITNATHYLTFVDSNNATPTGELVYTTSSFVINPNTGYIGMGTSTPGRPLHVVTIGTATQGIAAFEASASGLVIQDNSSKNGDVEIAGYRQSAATYHNIVIRADVLGLLVQKTTGNVGVGTLTPPSKFSVNSTATITALPTTMQISHGSGDWGLTIKRNTAESGHPNFSFVKSRAETTATIVQGDGFGRISWHAATSATAVTQVAEIGVINTVYDSTNTSADSNIYFSTKSTSTGVTEQVRITSTGSVGIGTSTPLSKFVVNGGTVNSVTYTSSEARIADGTLHLMKTSAGGVFEALRAINNDTNVGTTVRLLAAATSDPFNNANGGKVFIDAVRTASNMDLVFSLNDTGGAAAVERLRLLGSGAIAFNGAANYGSSGQILQSNGNAPPTWVAASGVGAGSATTSTNITVTNDTATITPQYITFVSTSTGGTGIKTAAISGLNYIPSTGYFGIGVNPPTAPLHIVSSVNSVVKFRGASTGQIGILFSDLNQAALTNNAGSEAYAIFPATNSLALSTNATNRITVDLNGQVKVLANIEATAVSTGSLVVTGGVGISGNLYAGGLINGGNGARITGTVTATTFVGNLTGNASGTASALSGGAAGSLPYQTGASTTGFLAISTAGYFLTAGATAPQWTQTLGVTNGGTGVTTLTGVVYGNGTTAFTAATGAQISTALGSTNISGSAANVTGTVLTGNGGTGLTSWTAGDLPYYASGTALSKLAISTSGYVLTSSGTAPQWTLASGLSAGSSASATNIAGGNTNQIPYQSGPGATAFSANLTWTNGTNTLSATGTINAAGALTRGGAVSSSAWSITSPVFHNAGTVLTDTSSGAGTVAARVGVSLHSPNFAASNAITITDAVNLYLQAPVASTNVGITNNWGLYNQGNTYLNGNVGIGRTTTSAKVDIFQENSFNATTPGTTTGYGIHLSGQTTADYATGITFSAGNASASNANAGIYSQGSGSYGTKMYLATTDSYATGAKTRLMIDHAGNVGIGTINPLSKFVVNGGSLSTTYTTSETRIADGSIHLMKTSAGGIFEAVRAMNLDTTAGTTVRLLAAATSDAFNNTNGGKVFVDAIRTSTNMDLAFSLNSTAGAAPVERVRFMGNGNVGIGTNNPTNKFEVQGTAGQLFSVSDSFTGTVFSANDVSGIPSIEVLDTGLVKLAQYNGQVAISTSTAVAGSALTVNGIISTTGSTGEIRASSEITAYYSSDSRLKENVTIISNPIEMLHQIRGVYFDWTDEHIADRGGEDGVFVRKHDVGVIAQEVEAILPEIVTTRDNGYKAVRYEKIVPLLIEAIKSQQSDIDILKAEIENLKKFIK